MDTAGNRKHDKILADLAGKIAEAKDKDIPKLLLQLQDLFDACKDNGKILLQLKQDAWGYDLLHVLSLSLGQDFTKVHGQWETAAKLTSILSEYCIGLCPTEDSQEFNEEFLPGAVVSFLVVAKKIQSRYIKIAKVLEDRKKTVFTAFCKTMESLTVLMSGHNVLAKHVLQSTVFLHLLMTEDQKTEVVLLSTLQSANRMNEHVMEMLSEKAVRSLLDEIIYKLSATSSDEVASCSCRTLLIICNTHLPTVKLLCERYNEECVKDGDAPRGLRPLLSKWMGHSFDRDLRRLTELLQINSAEQAKEQRIAGAAKIIQAWWRSHYTRSKLKRANTAFAKFQRSFRNRKEIEQQQKEENQRRVEHEHHLLLSQKRAMRELHQRRLHTIEFLPASEVDKHLLREQQEAAVMIQKTFRGYITCKKLASSKRNKLRNEAAQVIQRHVRKWMKKMRSRREEPPTWQRPPGLTDTRRVELQEQITAWRDNHVIKAKTQEEREALHKKVQHLLKHEAMMSHGTRKCQLRRETLLAQLSVDSKLIMDGPALADLIESDAQTYTSCSGPVVMRARFNHTQELRLLQQPWWRRLGDEYQDAKIDEEFNWKVY